MVDVLCRLSTLFTLEVDGTLIFPFYDNPTALGMFKGSLRFAKVYHRIWKNG